jgi:hypothetical protein
MLLKLGPEDVMYSVRLMQRSLALYVLSGFMLLINRVDASVAMVEMISDALVLMGFSYAVLASLNKKPRFVQTMSTLAGIGVIFHVLSLPLITALDNEPGDAASSLISLVMLMLISWQLLVIAHIYRRALNSSMMNAIALSFALLVISITVSRILFPEVP